MTRHQAQERHYPAAVEELLQLRRWKFVHHRNSIGTVAGWPDVFAVRGTRDRDRAQDRPRPSQQGPDGWIAALQVAGIEAMIVRLPSGWATIERVLR